MDLELNDRICRLENKVNENTEGVATIGSLVSGASGRTTVNANGMMI